MTVPTSKLYSLLLCIVTKYVVNLGASGGFRPTTKTEVEILRVLARRRLVYARCSACARRGAEETERFATARGERVVIEGPKALAPRARPLPLKKPRRGHLRLVHST